jgi:hypothetical protein
MRQLLFGFFDAPDNVLLLKKILQALVCNAALRAPCSLNPHQELHLNQSTLVRDYYPLNPAGSCTWSVGSGACDRAPREKSKRLRLWLRLPVASCTF